MADGIKYVGTRQHLYDDPPTFPNGQVDHWKAFVQKNERLDKLEKDHTNKLANKIIDKNYQQNKNKSPFTQVAENAVKELSFKMKDGFIENNAGNHRLDNVKEAIELNEALDKNFSDHKEDDYLKKLKNFGIENSQTKHPGYPKVSNPPILRNNINRVPKAAPVKLNPTVKKYKDFKENQKKKLEDEKFDKQFKKDYSDQAMENYVRGKVNKNIKAGKAPYEDLPTSYLIVGEHAKDKAKKRLEYYKKNPVQLPLPHIDLPVEPKTPKLPDFKTFMKSMGPTKDPDVDGGIAALDEIKKFKKTADLADQKFPKKYRGIGPFLTGEDD